MGNPAVLAAVLAGGSGSRLGGEKASALLGGRPLVRYPLHAAAVAGLPAVVVAKPDSELPPLDVEVVREPPAPRHPLCGLLAALRHAAELERGDAVLALACDMPFVSAALLDWIAGLEGAVLLRAGGRLHSLPVRCPTSALAVLEPRLRGGGPLREALAELEPQIVEEHELARFGDPRRLCMNVNDAGDLRSAHELLGAAAL